MRHILLPYRLLDMRMNSSVSLNNWQINDELDSTKITYSESQIDSSMEDGESTVMIHDIIDFINDRHCDWHDCSVNTRWHWKRMIWLKIAVCAEHDDDPCFYLDMPIWSFKIDYHKESSYKDKKYVFNWYYIAKDTSVIRFIFNRIADYERELLHDGDTVIIPLKYFKKRLNSRLGNICTRRKFHYGIKVVNNEFVFA